jgi:hypothetical protein
MKICCECGKKIDRGEKFLEAKGYQAKSYFVHQKPCTTLSAGVPSSRRILRSASKTLRPKRPR